MWQQLGIEPTRDEAGIRSAFRARMLALKRSGLHEDVRHVQPLREAYASALSAAAAGVDDDAAEQPSAQVDRPDETVGVLPITPAPDHGSHDSRPPQPATQPVAATDDASGTPAPEHSQQAEAPVEDLCALAAETTRAFIRSKVPPAHLPRRWRQLCQQPQWQRPAAARALQQALALRLLEFAPTLRAHQAQSAAVQAAMRLSERWLALTVFAADLHRWWPPRPPGHAAHLPAADALWQLACAVSIDLLLQRLHRRQTSDACSRLNRWLHQPVMQALDNRAAWLSRCAVRLGEWPDVPAEFIEALMQGFDLHELQPGAHSEPAVNALLTQYHAQQGTRLLHRIARGQQAHAVISPQMAAALLQPAISLADRQAVRSGQLVDQKLWLAQVRNAIAWLREHVPDALDPTEPAVLRWWCGPHVTPRAWWDFALMLGAVPGSVVGLLLFDWCFDIESAAAMGVIELVALLVFVLGGMAAGAWLGWRAGGAVTWLHMHWSTWLYPAWRRRESAWARRIPLIGSLLPRLNIWLSRNLLVLWGLLQVSESFTLDLCLAFAAWRLLLWVAARGRF